MPDTSPAAKEARSRWIIDPQVREAAPDAVDWAKGYLGAYDLTALDWVRIDRGRERPGHRAPQGVYGRCWYPTGRGKARKGFRISCQVPGPFPYTIRTRTSPVYVTLARHYGPRPDHLLDEEGSAVFEMGVEDGQPFWDIASEPRPANCSGQGRRGDTAWWQTIGATTVNDLGEAIAWIIGHEAFHFLRRSRQVPGRNTEIEADAAADRVLADYRAARADKEDV